MIVFFYLFRQSTARSFSNSSGDSPQRISAGGVSLEEEDEEKLEIYSSENNFNVKPSTKSTSTNKPYSTVSPCQSPSILSQQLQRSNVASPALLSVSSLEQQQQKQQRSSNIPSKVRRISQNSARSSPPPLHEVQLDSLSNDSSSGSLLDRSVVASGLPYADQMSLGSSSRSPVQMGSSAMEQTHLPKLLKPQPFHSNGAGGDRKFVLFFWLSEAVFAFGAVFSDGKWILFRSHSTKPGCIAPGPIVHREHTAHVRPFRVSQSQPPTPRILNSPEENNANRKDSEVKFGIF